MLEFLQNSGLALLATAAIAYLCGSVSFAIIVTKLFSKKDIRDFGSGNAGATNVLRSQGKLPAILTTIGDLAKSFVAVYVGGLLLTSWQLNPYNGAFGSGSYRCVYGGAFLYHRSYVPALFRISRWQRCDDNAGDDAHFGLESGTHFVVAVHCSGAVYPHGIARFDYRRCRPADRDLPVPRLCVSSTVAGRVVLHGGHWGDCGHCDHSSS